MRCWGPRSELHRWLGPAGNSPSAPYRERSDHSRRTPLGLDGETLCRPVAGTISGTIKDGEGSNKALLPAKQLIPQCAGMAELADATDLKSVAAKAAWGFEALSRQ